MSANNPVEREAALRRVVRAISSSTGDPQPALATIVEQAAQLCGASYCALLRGNAGSLELAADYNGNDAIRDLIQAIPVVGNETRGSYANALSSGHAVQIADVLAELKEHQAFAHCAGEFEQLGLRSLIGVPLTGLETAGLETEAGVLVAFRAEVGAFDDLHIEFLQALAEHAVLALGNAHSFQAARQARERQTAMAAILRIISQSPSDTQPVFEIIVEKAAALCGASLGFLLLVRDGALHPVAWLGTRPATREFVASNPIPLDSQTNVARAVFDGEVRQVEDIAALRLGGADSQYRSMVVELEDMHTQVSAPLRRGGDSIGVLGLFRREARLFDEQEVELLSIFADQAVIAIENARLFAKSKARTEEAEEALKRQTATSDVLRVISQSPTDAQPVFKAILDKAASLCGASNGHLILRDGDVVRQAASLRATTSFDAYLASHPARIDGPSMVAQSIRECEVVQIEDLRDTDLYRQGDPLRVATVDLEGTRSQLCVPLRKGTEAIGTIVVYRREVRAFDAADIELLSTFADQAVIAVENVRLFETIQARTEEAQEALKRQTATSDVLRVISQSPTDTAPVFQAIVEKAAWLCGASHGALLLRAGDILVPAASLSVSAELVDYLTADPVRLDTSPPSSVARSVLNAEVVQIEDMRDGEGNARRATVVRIEGTRTLLCVPLRKGSEAVGVLVLFRREVRLFAGADIELVSTFADQAVIAIENSRLFETIQARTEEVQAALERQTATSEILRVISESPTDSQPVFAAIVDKAARLCGAAHGGLFLRDGNVLTFTASVGGRNKMSEFYTANPVALDGPTMAARSVRDAEIVHTEDLRDATLPGFGSASRQVAIDTEGIRTHLCVPLRKGSEAIGTIVLYRREVRLFAGADIDLVSTFADQAVIAIENVRLFQTLEARTGELSRSVSQLEALSEIGQAVSSTLDIDTVLETIVNQAVALSDAGGGLIAEYDEEAGTLPIRAGQGYATLLSGMDPVQVGQGVMGRAVAARRPVQVPDVDEPGAYTGPLRPILKEAGLKALLALPLLREERVLGALMVGRSTAGNFNQQTVELLETFAAQSALAIDNARVYQALEAQGQALDAANRHKSEFLANMSHELRTPLNAVIGFSEVLGDELFGELNEKQAEYVHDIHDSGRHLLSLINDILDLSKIEAGHMELDVSRFDLRGAIDVAMTLVGERATRRQLTLESDIDENLGEFTGDERKFKQILLNLLSNAIKFTPEGGQVKLTARNAGAHIEVAVHDTGVGMSEEEQSLVFEAFRQVGTDYARKGEGTGLGLTLTRQFVELHGGEIKLTSAPGAGSVFRVILPHEPAGLAAEQ